MMLDRFLRSTITRVRCGGMTRMANVLFLSTKSTGGGATETATTATDRLQQEHQQAAHAFDNPLGALDFPTPSDKMERLKVLYAQIEQHERDLAATTKEQQHLHQKQHLEENILQQEHEEAAHAFDNPLGAIDFPTSNKSMEHLKALYKTIEEHERRLQRHKEQLQDFIHDNQTALKHK